MFTKDHLLNQLRHETKICKHLHSKLEAKHVDQKLGDNMRSTIELMRYLSCCGIVPAQSLVANDWSKAGDSIKEMDTMNADGFAKAMDAQMAALEELLGGYSDADLASKQATMPWGTTVSLGEALVTTSLSFMTAYRMQLFLHLKAGGRSELTTANCWMGSDPS